MSNKYRVWISQEVKFPVEVIANDEDEAIDAISREPNRLTDQHQLCNTNDPESWEVDVIETDIDLSTQWSIDPQQLINQRSEELYNLAYKELDDFSALSYAQRGSHSWCAGVYESLLRDLIAGNQTGLEALQRIQLLADGIKSQDVIPN